jgi:hypothetical protein
MTSCDDKGLPAWFVRIFESGFQPYIATSECLLPYLNTMPFGQQATCFVMENGDHEPFFEAYLLANSLGFESPGLKMPHWVMVDCAVMQTAIVGFMKSKSEISDSLARFFREDKGIAFDKLSHIPVSGQISASAIDGKSLIGFSLFSLQRKLNGPRGLGIYTKALAFEVYQAKKYQSFRAISYYDSAALRIHGRFSSEMEIDQAIVPLHPRKDMALLYKMAIKFDPNLLDEPLPDVEPSFWLNAEDAHVKRDMRDGMRQGKKYIIAPPFSVQRDGSIYLPIIERDQ